MRTPKIKLKNYKTLGEDEEQQPILDESYVELINNSTIVFDGYVNSKNINTTIKHIYNLTEQYKRVENEFSYSVKPHIKLMLTTVGGDIPEAFRLINVMENNDIPVCVYASGMIASAGVWITSLAKKRVAYRHTHFFLHKMIAGFEGSYNSVQSQHDHIVDLQEYIYQLLVDSTKLSYEDVVNLCEKEKYFSAKEALEFGIIDEIL